MAGKDIKLKKGVVLTCVHHDPEARLLYLLDSEICKLKSLYKDIIIAVSPLTDKRVIRKLLDLEIRVSILKVNWRGDAYREAMKVAYDSGFEQIHYCDFDRILHWTKFYYTDLKNLLDLCVSEDFCYIIGRTNRAYLTHEESLYLTEQPLNVLISSFWKFKKVIDVSAFTFLLPRRIIKKLLIKSKEKDSEFYGEWLSILGKICKIKYIERDGLDWETPDQYKNEIKKVGLKKWKENFDTKERWRFRVIFINKCLKGAVEAQERLK